jgi:ADP-heptose:LPS heptosyltransferase
VTVATAGSALAVHPGALGDVLLAIPALRALRAASGGVTLAAQRHLADLVVALGEADGAREFESLRLDALFAGTGAADLPDADRVICWFGARDADFGRRLRAQAPAAVVAPSVSTGLVWRHLLATSGASATAPLTPVRVEPALCAAGRAMLVEAGWDGRRRLLVVQPGAGGVAKRWPVDAFAAALAPVAHRGDVAIVLHRGPADTEAVAALGERLPSALQLSEPALPALAGVLREAALYLGNDCGVSHLAATVGAPAVVLFAASNLPWRPWAQAPMVMTVTMGRADPAEVAAVRDAVERRLA